jgi:hypothetical protein
MSDAVDDAIKQIVLAHADGEIKSIAVVMIKQDGEPEMQISMAPDTAYALISGMEILKMRFIHQVITQGGIKPKDRN